MGIFAFKIFGFLRKFDQKKNCSKGLCWQDGQKRKKNMAQNLPYINQNFKSSFKSRYFTDQKQVRIPLIIFLQLYGASSFLIFRTPCLPRKTFFLYCLELEYFIYFKNSIKYLTIFFIHLHFFIIFSCLNNESDTCLQYFILSEQKILLFSLFCVKRQVLTIRIILFEKS